MRFSCFHSQLCVFFPPQTREDVVSVSLNFNIKYRNTRPTIFLFLCKKPRGFPPPSKLFLEFFFFLKFKKKILLLSIHGGVPGGCEPFLPEECVLLWLLVFNSKCFPLLSLSPVFWDSFESLCNSRVRHPSTQSSLPLLFHLFILVFNFLAVLCGTFSAAHILSFTASGSRSRVTVYLSFPPVVPERPLTLHLSEGASSELSVPFFKCLSTCHRIHAVVLMDLKAHTFYTGVFNFISSWYMVIIFKAMHFHSVFRVASSPLLCCAGFSRRWHIVFLIPYP